MGRADEPYVFAYLGVALASILSTLGSLVGMYGAGLFVAASPPSLSLHSWVLVVINGVLAIYGLVISVVLSGRIAELKDGEVLGFDEGFRYFASGLTVGCACLCAGIGLGYFCAKAATGMTTALNAKAQDPDGEDRGALGPTFNAMSYFRKVAAMAVFFEATGLYGLIVSLILAGTKRDDSAPADLEPASNIAMSLF